MADVAIRQTAVTAVPLDYTLTGAQELAPKAVSASLDGTSAGSSWFPCLEVLDPAGNVMFTAIASTSLAAGVSADVTWFPRVNAVTGSGASSLTVTDGTTSVFPSTTVDFTSGATVTNGGGGIADVAIAASPLTTKGDIFGHSTVDARIPVGADTTVLTADSTQALGVKYANVSSLSGGRPNVQVFGAGAGQTWTKPAGTTAVCVVCIGSGGGGGGGGGGGASNGTPGGGGGGAAISETIFQTSDVPGTVTVNVGAGGGGGSGGINGATGGNGTDGAITTFGTLLSAGGGGGGTSAVANSNTRGGGGGSTVAAAASFNGGNPAVTGPSGGQIVPGGSGCSSATGNHVTGIMSDRGGSTGAGGSAGVTGVAGGSSMTAGAGGGGGGGNSPGGAGGTTNTGTVGGGGAGGNGGTNTVPTKGTDGTSFVGPFCGSSGGGGGGTTTGAATCGAGGAGGIGCGGGGGGAPGLSATVTGGAGGAGGDGRCIVISW